MLGGGIREGEGEPCEVQAVNQADLDKMRKMVQNAQDDWCGDSECCDIPFWCNLRAPGTTIYASELAELLDLAECGLKKDEKGV